MLINEFVKREEINKGWSGDKKYRVTDKKGGVYLLRISDISQLERKKIEYEYMKYCAEKKLPICVPISFGVCEEGAYSVQSWIEGDDAEKNISVYSETEQYNYGVEAGKILRVMHSIPAPAETPEWSSRFNKKADRKIAMYSECDIKYENGTLFIDYINAHRHLLQGRPSSFQHGDYHIGNMMIGKNKKLYVIDFNRFDFGDPWEEFNRIVWCVQASHSFASGMVDGYFENIVPLQFWELLALYISSNTLGSLPWAVRFGKAEIEIMQNQAKYILNWYNNMQTPIPSWYKSR